MSLSITPNRGTLSECIGVHLDPHVSASFLPKDFEQVDQALKKERIVLISGDDGVHTSFIKGYVQSNRGRYRLVVWIDGRCTSSISLAASRVSRVAGHRARYSLTSLIQAVHRAFDDWLFVVEGHEHEEKLDLPVGTNGKLIVLLENKGNQESHIHVHTPQLLIGKMFETVMKRQADAAEEKLFHRLEQSVKGCPVALRIVLCYLCETKKTIADYLEFLTSLPRESSPLGAIVEQTLKGWKTGDDNARSAYKLINCWTHFHSMRVPVAVLEALFVNYENPQQVIKRSLALLEQYGLIQQETVEDEVIVSLDRKVQSEVVQLQEKDGEDYFIQALFAISQVFSFSREKYSKDVQKADLELAAVHMEKVLKTAFASQRKFSIIDAQSLARACNSMGRFYQSVEAFQIALKWYKKALASVNVRINFLKQHVETIVGHRHLKSEILHNLGSCSVRVWEQLSKGEKSVALNALEESCVKFQIRDEKIFRIGSAPGAYERKHFTAYSLRNLARAYKKDGNLEAARDVLEKIHRIKEYVKWPKESEASESLPLSLMDLGVIYRLMAQSEEKRSMDALDLGNHDDKKRESDILQSLNLEFWGGNKEFGDVGIKRAVEFLEKSVRFYEADNYFFKNQNYDLGIALVRLGEAHLDVGAHDSKEEALVRAQQCFLRASYLLARHFQNRPSINEARAYYRLAEALMRIGNISGAIIFAKEALALQEELFPVHHPYLLQTQFLLKKAEGIQAKSEESDLYYPPVGRMVAISKPQYQASKQKPLSGELLKTRGLNAFQLRDWDQAIQDISACLFEYSDAHSLRVTLGHAYLQNKDFEQAALAYLEAMYQIQKQPFSRLQKKELDALGEASQALSSLEQHGLIGNAVKHVAFTFALEVALAEQLMEVVLSMPSLEELPILKDLCSAHVAASSHLRARRTKGGLGTLGTQKPVSMEWSNLRKMSRDEYVATLEQIHLFFGEVKRMFKTELLRMNLRNGRILACSCVRRLISGLKENRSSNREELQKELKEALMVGRDDKTVLQFEDWSECTIEELFNSANK